MLAPAGNARIFLHPLPVDLRKGFEGLGGLVQQAFGAQLLTGAYFIFLNRTKDRMKVLYWDSDGLAIWYKRLERGRFRSNHATSVMIDRREFLMLLEGVTPRHVHKRFKMA